MMVVAVLVVIIVVCLRFCTGDPCPSCLHIFLTCLASFHVALCLERFGERTRPPCGPLNLNTRLELNKFSL